MRTELFWIDGPWPGRLAIMPRPRGGDWLEEEIQSWRRAKLDVDVSLLQADEIDELDLAQESSLCSANGIEFITFPILDRGVPTSAPATVDLVRRLDGKLSDGKNVAIHCRQGVGRSALIAASLMALKGVDVSTAFDRIGKARGARVPDTAEQRAWVDRLAKVSQPPMAAATIVAIPQGFNTSNPNAKTP